MMSRDEIAREIFEQAKRQNVLEVELGKFAEKVRDYWRSVSPVDSGEYAASVQVFKKKITVDGMPAKRVGATDFKAHWIEYGTGQPGPTQAAAPRAKTAVHFGGDESVIRADVSADSEGEQ